MLTVGDIHSAVADDSDAVRLRNVANPNARRDPTDPGYVGLENVNEALSGGQSERVDGVPVLAGRERLARDALAHFEVAVHVLGEQVVLQPLDAIRFERLGPA